MRTTIGLGRTAVLLAAAAFVAFLTLGPRAIIAPARHAFVTVADAAVAPVLGTLTYLDAERSLNMLMFVPLGGAVAALLPLRMWMLALLASPAVSLVVETAQASIPGRVPDLDDVVWNTLGGTLGVVVVVLARAGHAVAGRLSERRERSATAGR